MSQTQPKKTEEEEQTGKELASFRTQSSRIRQMLDYSSLNDLFGRVYINIQEGEISLIGAEEMARCATYDTFTSEWFDDISVNAENEGGVEAILKVEEFRKYLDLASGSGTVEVSLHGNEEDRLATSLEANGALNLRVFLPASLRELEQIPLDIVQLFDEDQNYTPAGTDDPLPTEIISDTATFERIINAVEAQEDEQNPAYPVVVEDGDLTLEVQSGTGRNSVWGSLEVQSIQGPDVSNEYFLGFDDTFGVFSGDVRVQVGPGPDNDEIVVTKGLADGGVLRSMVACMGDN